MLIHIGLIINVTCPKMRESLPVIELFGAKDTELLRVITAPHVLDSTNLPEASSCECVVLLFEEEGARGDQGNSD